MRARMSVQFRPTFSRHVLGLGIILFLAVGSRPEACSLDALETCKKSDARVKQDTPNAEDAEQLRKLAEYYRDAPEPIQNHALAIKYFQSAAQAGDLWSMKELSEMLLNGEGIPANPKCGVALLAHAAGSGLAGSSLNTLGDYYRSTGSYDKALDAYQRASSAGEVWAMKSLAEMLFQGEGTSSDPKRAISLLEQAKDKGLIGPSLYALGIYFQSIGQSAKALKAYQEASDAGEVWATFGLAQLLLSGEGVAPDTRKAIVLFRKAPEGGLRGQSYLAMGLYYRGVGKFAKAMDAFQVASDAGQSAATQALAEMLFKGEGTRPNVKRAIALLQAANLPIPNAQSIPDPPSTYTGQRTTIADIMKTAFDAGFQSEPKLLSAVAVAISESGLWTAARNWQPDRGYRPRRDKIDVEGPRSAWSDDKRQLHSDRGLWQISSFWYPNYSDIEMDDPPTAAAAAYEVSKSGTQFSSWDSYRSGYAQSLFDKSVDGWPALRPLVIEFLASKESVEAREPEWTECLSNPEFAASD